MLLNTALPFAKKAVKSGNWTESEDLASTNMANFANFAALKNFIFLYYFEKNNIYL